MRHGKSNAFAAAWVKERSDDMGKLLGAHGADELDRPDLNKCPDCQCFFAGLNCPICGKLCPEEMRAGNRKAVKVKKRRGGSSGRVTFVQWYHSWWFIVLMLVMMPILGVILLITSPHERWKKIVFAVIAAIYLVVSSIGIGAIWSRISVLWDRPVDTSMTKEEYVTACAEIDATDFYRSYRAYDGKKLKMTLVVQNRGLYMDDYYYVHEDIYYVCRAKENPGVVVLLRSCLVEGESLLIAGDEITVYGEGDGYGSVFIDDGSDYEGPILNMAYVTVDS